MASARFEMKEGDEHGRKKLKISRITSQKSRQVTFNKRKVGLMKKAMELSILCDVEIAVILFDNQKQLYQYSTRNTAQGMEQLIQRWQQYDGSYEALSNNDLQSLKPGRAASFKVGKKRKSANGKSLPSGTPSHKKGGGDSDDDDEEDDEDEEAEDGDKADTGDGDKATPRATNSTYKHTNTHPLHSPSLHMNSSAAAAASAQQQLSNALANTVHPMLTPLSSPHSFAAMLSPASLPSASSLGGAGFGSNYPFGQTPQQQQSSALQQVLNSQAAMLSPSTANGTSLNNMTSAQLQQLVQLQQQQQVQAQQQQLVAALAAQQQQQQVQAQQQQAIDASIFNLMNSNKMLGHSAPSSAISTMTNPYHGMLSARTNSSPTVASAMAALVAQNQAAAQQQQANSHSLSVLLSPAGGVPPSPGSVFSAPLGSPSFQHSYNQFLSSGSSAMTAANLIQLQQLQHQQQLQLTQQQAQEQQQLTAVLAAQQSATESAMAITPAHAASVSPPAASPRAPTAPKLTVDSSNSASPPAITVLPVNSAASTAAAASSIAAASSSATAAPASSSSSAVSGSSASGSSIPPLNPVLSSSSSSLLSKRAPFKVPLSLEIPRGSNASADITNGPAQPQPPQQQQQQAQSNPAASQNAGANGSAQVSPAPDSSIAVQIVVDKPEQGDVKPTLTLHQQQQQQQQQQQNGSMQPPPLPVSAPAHSSLTDQQSQLQLHHHHQQSYPASAYAHSHSSSMMGGVGAPGFSPLTSPSAFMNADQHAQAAMLFSINGNMSGMTVNSAQQQQQQQSMSQSQQAQQHAHQSAQIASTQSQILALQQQQASLGGGHHQPSHSHLPSHQQHQPMYASQPSHLQPPVPVSPYGQWGTSFSGGMDAHSKIYSPTALRSPAAAQALFSRNPFQ